MTTVSLAEAKAHLSKLVDRVEAGETINISRRGSRLHALRLSRNRGRRSMSRHYER